MIDHKINVLSKIAKQLNDLNILWCVGASVMLYLRGIVDDFNDIDILIEEKDATQVKHVFESLGKQQFQIKSAQYQTTHFYEFLIDNVDIDIIAGYQIVRDSNIYYIPLKKEHITDYIEMNQTKVPIGSLTDWLKYYELMKRTDKVDIIEKYLRGQKKS